MSTEWWASLPDADVPCRRQSCGHRVDLAQSDHEQHCDQCGDPGLGCVSESRDLVPSTWTGLTSTWDWATRTNVRRPSQTDWGALSTVEHLAAAISAPRTHSLHLPVTPLCTPHWPQGAEGFLVWRAATAGCTVHAGTVELPERGVLLLAGAGAHFHGTTFKGGVVMCAGAHFSGTFHNCNFQSTTVYAVHGAAVTLLSCRIAGAYPGLVASGDATVVTLSDCRISRCSTSVVVERGATLAADSCTISKTLTGIAVNDACSTAALARSVLVGGGLSCILGLHGITMSSAAVRLYDCRVSDFIEAVRVARGTQRSTVQAQRLHVAGVMYGVLTESSARLTLRECHISVSARPSVKSCSMAVSLGQTRLPHKRSASCLQMERCDMHDTPTGGGGLAVTWGSHASAVLCRTRCSHAAAYVRKGGRAALAHCKAATLAECLSVHDPGSALRLQGGCYEGEMACEAEADARVAAADCVLRTCRGAGEWEVVSVLRAATVRLLRCHVSNGHAGVSCTAGTVFATDTTVSDIQPVRKETESHVCGGAGYLVQGGGVTIKGGTVEKCLLGLVSGGDLPPGVPASVSLCGVTFSGCVSGVKLTQPGAEADVRHCIFRGLGNEQVAGKMGVVEEGTSKSAIVFADAGGGCVTHCDFSGFQDAVSACTPDAVTVRDCTFQGALADGVYVAALGPVVVENCSFAGSAATGVAAVYAGHGGACTIRGCRMNALSGRAVMAAQGAGVKLLHTTVHGCGTGVALSSGADLSAQDCKVTGGDVGVAVAAGGASFTAKRMSIQAASDCVSVRCAAGVPTLVKLVDSELSGAEQGLRVMPEPPTVDGNSMPCQRRSKRDAAHATTVTMLRCSVSGCRVAGVWVCGPAAVRLTSTRVSQCMAGMLVGELPRELAMPCRVCGRSGEAAVRQAFEKLRGGGSAAATARCAHEGAVARLRLADCEVVDCDKYAMLVSEPGHVEASNVTAVACHLGVFVRHVSERSVFSGCTVIGCAGQAAEVPVESVDTMLTWGELDFDLVRPLPEVAIVMP